MIIKVGARDSKLSKKQTEEALEEIKSIHPNLSFDLTFLETMGDRNQKASLRPLDKTDFFTKEIDTLLLEGKCQIAIHSAKDLPAPLPKRLRLIALTKGVDPSDSLVMRPGMQLDTLPKRALVGSSSFRRDAVIRTLRPDLRCIEVRGKVDERIKKLEKGEVDALVVAEAALIRLGLTDLNRISLPGSTAPLQGQLAILAREEDVEMATLFSSIDVRSKKTALYTGLDPKHFGRPVIHCPLIQIVPRDFDSLSIRVVMDDVSLYTHLIFTSKAGVDVFCDCLIHYGYKVEDLLKKRILAVGKVTAERLRQKGLKVTEVAQEETQEGMIKMLAIQDLDEAYFLLPQSSLARTGLAHFLMVRRVRHQVCALYDTKPRKPDPLPGLEEVDEIVFTSPSTVKSFIQFFGQIPPNKKITSIGPITQKALEQVGQYSN